MKSMHPYVFVSKSGKEIKGLFINEMEDLVERPDKSALAHLIQEAEKEAVNDGFDFIFVLPQTDLMRPFYEEKGFLDAFYKIKERYVKGHHFKISKEVKARKWQEQDQELIMEFLRTHGDKVYSLECSFLLKHTSKDWEEQIKKYLAQGKEIYLGFEGSQLAGVAFARKGERAIEIDRIYVVDKEYEGSLLTEISGFNPEYGLNVTRDLEEVVNSPVTQLWSPYYAQNNGKTAEYEDVAVVEEPFSPARNASSYGMVKIFNLQGILDDISSNYQEALRGYSDGEIMRLILRRPVGKTSDGLEKIMNLPELSLNVNLIG